MSRVRHARLTAPSWPRLPRRTARLRLTLLSGALFLLSGATLLTVIYVLFLLVRASGSGSARSSGSSNSQASLPNPSGSQSSLGVDQVHKSGGGAAAAAQRFADQHDLLIACAIGLAVAAVFAVLLGWFVAGRMLRPVRAITTTARRISATNLNERLALDDADEEFKQLADTLDNLFARLGAAFEAQQHFVANASHELRTPLTRERTLLQVALDDPLTTKTAWRSTAEELLASSDEQERLIEALLTLASSQGGLDHLERVDLAAICNDVLLRPNPDIDRLGLQVEVAIGSARLDGDPRLIERLVANLVDNATSHNVTGGHLQVTTVSDSAKTVLTVANTGPVIPAADVDRLFQPFQRLDPGRTHHKNGHGLGLSIVRAITSAHGATITAHPRPQGGLRVEVTFPPPSNGHHAQCSDSGAHYGRQLSAQDARETSTPDSRTASSPLVEPSTSSTDCSGRFRGNLRRHHQ
jgi:signal transduction histidine kinase